MRLLQLALSIDENDSNALSLIGRVSVFLYGDFDAGIEMVDRAVALNPNSAFSWDQRGWTYYFACQGEEAIRSFERAIRLSPVDPLIFSSFTGMGLALLILGRFDEAVAAAKKAIHKNPQLPTPYRCLAAALAHLGREEEVRDAVARLLDRRPNFRISEWAAGTDLEGLTSCMSMVSSRQAFRNDAAALPFLCRFSDVLRQSSDVRCMRGRKDLNQPRPKVAFCAQSGQSRAFPLGGRTDMSQRWAEVAF